MIRLLPLASAALVCATLAALAFVETRPTPRAHGRLRQSVYVWQRSWTPAVRDAVRRHARAFTGTVVLGAEIAWSRGEPRVTHVDAERGDRRGPFGVALRIGACPRVPGSAVEDTSVVVETARSLVDPRSPSELQLDFDCAETRLDGYRVWLAAVRDAVAPVPVTVTALPSWLDRDAFARLARESDGFVLQVHSLDPPSGPSDPTPLCDPERAVGWVETAARVGVPFRVALPTYGYVLGWSSTGRFLGVGAEGPRPGWPRDTIVRELSADAGSMASLVRRWRADRPAAMDGVIWYRMPVAGDERNWRWPTLVRVMRGQDVRPDVVADASRPVAELVDCFVENRGTADGVGDAPVDVTWRGARLVGSDGSRGFEIVRTGTDRIRFRPVRPTGDRLSPRERRFVGWLRFDGAAEVDVHVAK